MASCQQGESAKAAPELELSRAKRNFRLRALSRAVAEPSRTVATLGKLGDATNLTVRTGGGRKTRDSSIGGSFCIHLCRNLNDWKKGTGCLMRGLKGYCDAQ